MGGGKRVSVVEIGWHRGTNRTRKMGRWARRERGRGRSTKATNKPHTHSCAIVTASSLCGTRLPCCLARSGQATSPVANPVFQVSERASEWRGCSMTTSITYLLANVRQVHQIHHVGALIVASKGDVVCVCVCVFPWARVSGNAKWIACSGLLACLLACFHSYLLGASPGSAQPSPT